MEYGDFGWCHCALYPPHRRTVKIGEAAYCWACLPEEHVAAASLLSSLREPVPLVTGLSGTVVMGTVLPTKVVPAYFTGRPIPCVSGTICVTNVFQGASACFSPRPLTGNMPK